MRNTGLDEAQTGIKIAGRNKNNLRYAADSTLMVENKLMVIRGKGERQTERLGLADAVCVWALDSSLCFIQPGISHDVLCI